ncbi:Undecaprenyl-diphosphatase BcrC [compost metagenome]
MAVYGSPQLFLRLRADLGPITDLIFRSITELGSATFSVLVALFLIYRNKRSGLFASLAMIVATVITHLVKFWVNAPRPSIFFANTNPIKSIDGVQLLTEHSFPSGHTTAAFALACVLTFITVDKRWSIFYFFMALMVGFSRIYLGQHFPVDVYAGSLIAVGSCSLVWGAFENRSQNYKQY